MNYSNTSKYKNLTAKGNIGTFLMFLIWPFGGFLWSFKNYKNYSSRNLTWLYIIFFGFTFIFEEGTDSIVYSLEFKEMAQNNMNIFEYIFDVFTNETTGRYDFVQPLIDYILSRFTDSKYILMATYGAFFGYFYSRNIWFLIDQVKTKIKIESLAYFLYFCILVPYWSINGFRFWTAAHVFIFGCISYIFLEKKKKGGFFILLSAFIHDTYIIAVGIFLIYLLLHKIKTIPFLYYYLYIFSIFSNIPIITTLTEKMKVITEYGIKNRSSYLNETYVEQYMGQTESLNWYVKYQYTLSNILVGLSFTWILFFRKKLLLENKQLLGFFSIGILFITFTNFMSGIPAMDRFFYLGYLSMAIMLFLFFQNMNFQRRPEWYKVLSLSTIILLYISEIWHGSLLMSLTSFISNPITALFFESDYSLYDLVKKGIFN